MSRTVGPAAMLRHVGQGRRDVERIYSAPELVAKLRRLADALEQDKPFRIQIAGERFQVPVRAQFSVEHERGEQHEEVEFQFTWSLDPADVDAHDAPVV